MTRRPSVVLADDHAMVLAGLSRLIEGECELVGKAADGQQLLEVVSKCKPDIVVADISMPLLNGIEAVRQLRKGGIGSKVIFLTMHSDVTFAVEALEAGASGYLLKQSAAEELLSAIREVMQGRAYVTPLIAKEVLETFMRGGRRPDRPSVQLTARERQTLQLVAEGRSTKEIATLLNISTRTVEFHKYNVMEKLNLRTTAELTHYAVKHGIVSS